LIAFDAKKYTNLVSKNDKNRFFGPLVKFFERAVNLYAIPFFAILIVFAALYLIWFIFGNLLGGLIRLMFSCCKIKLSKEEAKEDQFFDARVPTKDMLDELDLFYGLDSKGFYKDPKLRKITLEKLKIYNRRI
jgi:hypothetical protein